MKKNLLTLLLFTLSCTLIYAQDSNQQLLDKLVEKNILSKTEADEIKKESALSKEKQTQETLKSIFKSEYAELGGFGQLLYDYNSVRPSKNDFEARSLYLTINGKLNKYFSYGMMLEFTTPKMVEYWTQFSIHPAFNLKLGQYKPPITIESVIGAAAIETIDYSRVARNLIGYGQPGDVMKLQNGKGNMGRDLGLQASGEFISMGTHNLLQYDLGVFQGAGMNSGDTNNNKDLATKLLVQPIKGLRIGGGAYFGSASYAHGFDPSTGNPLGITSHVRNRYFAGGEYKSSNLLLRAEYLKGNDAGIKKDGAYGTAIYQVAPGLGVLAKFDYYNNNKDYHTEVYDYSGGLRYQFWGLCTGILQYTYTDASDRWTALSKEKTHHRVAAQLQVMF